MFCRNCGQKLADGDKFCSGCGTKTQVEENAAPAAEDKPIFEPFDFKAFGFDFADLGLGLGAKEEKTVEETKPTPPTEKFDWNTGAFPDTNTTSKTEEVNFNWSLTPEEPKAAEPETFKAEEPVWTGAEPAEEQISDLEAELFGDIESKADETRKQSEEIDKFFTFHKKNEEFQKILDREYEKVKSGNIITEELNEAEAASEEKFTARQPEDPMEELFAEAGVIKGYEPKPLETDVLERIEAAEEEKRIQEEAVRIAEEKRAAMVAEEAAKAEEPAAVETAVEETAEPAAETEAAPVVEEAPAAEAEPAAEEVQEVVPAEDMPEKTKQVDKAAILAEMALASEMVERDRAFAAAKEAEAAAAVSEEAKFDLPDFLGHQETEEVQEEASAEETVEEAPVEISVADAIAEITEAEGEDVSIEDVIAELAAEETPVEEAPVEETVEETPAEEDAQDEIQTEEPAPAVEEEEAVAETEDGLPELELDIFEQLEAVETPAAEIVLTEAQTIEDLFADVPEAEAEEETEEAVTEHTVILTEDSVAEILKTVEEDTTTDDTMVFTAHALGALLAEAEQEDPDAKEVVVSLEELTSLEEQAANGTLPGIADVEEAAEEEEEIKGGKGRTFLKVILVILVILLVVEIAGVAIKIAAPTSGAANFIDNQLNKVFQLIGDEDTAPEDFNA